MKKNRAFLKWAGGKYGLIEPITRLLPSGNKLIEPFVGAGSVFLNTDYSRYLLNDINQDLITLYRTVKRKPVGFIKDARTFFNAQNNTEQAYYSMREQFNASTDGYERSLLFLYLNRHGYNGLCRYNSSGGFNVPFGQYRKPYFPEAELEHFAEKAKRATFTCLSFEDVFRRARTGDVMYCDPPYAPLTTTANFTSYASGGFNLEHQHELALRAERLARKRDIPVLVSNHDTELTRVLYKNAQLTTLQVARSISQNGAKRHKVAELLALFPANTDSIAQQNVIHLNQKLKKVAT
ncbi:DNA adenine methylase Dam [Pseudidiomarina planktonica]|uniref:Site-specific DNA-methyltransferase (adenine-specific) n=1 Tax=Pseudidiomarina planktonica TaxID=1323738 RepID=A0A1Y6FY42_9GAMM|nr:Dam family site-specific DNA-(adenine-N6)-methyltransferase [Pseudidiomarina planktonica]RUO64016.1 DNA adenine methylase [Pseudidiomarina planktonica]SMQ79890.1 DNA adenine methylase Dam [Pseudidiomarina planktonica]